MSTLGSLTDLTRKQRMPHDPSDPFGLAAWAASHDLAAGDALALASCVLVHLAGRAVLCDDLTSVAVSAPGLAGASDDIFLTEALNGLLTNPKLIQEMLVRKASTFSKESIVGAMFDKADGSSPHLRVLSILSDSVDPDRYTHPIPQDAEGWMNADLYRDPRQARFEVMLRPRFMFDGVLPCDLTTTLSIMPHPCFFEKPSQSRTPFGRHARRPEAGSDSLSHRTRKR